MCFFSAAFGLNAAQKTTLTPKWEKLHETFSICVRIFVCVCLCVSTRAKPVGLKRSDHSSPCHIYQIQHPHSKTRTNPPVLLLNPRGAPTCPLMFLTVNICFLCPPFLTFPFINLPVLCNARRLIINGLRIQGSDDGGN